MCQSKLIKVIITTGLIFPTSKAIHEETNRKVEKWCEIMNFVLAKFTPNVALFLMLVIGYFGYFATNLGSNAFELLLVLPMW